MLKRFTLFFTITLLLLSCSEDSTPSAESQNPKFLSGKGAFKQSTALGNFVTTAIQRSNNLDFAFLPSAYFSENMIAYIKPGMNEFEINEVLELFPRGPKDQILIGTMRGKDLKRFIRGRCQENYNSELETAGLWYGINFKGGFITAENYLIDNRFPVEDDRYYRIAVSDDFYFGSAFPGYKYRNSFNFSFRREKYQKSIRESIKSYLENDFPMPLWTRRRAIVTQTKINDIGFKKINEIQGVSHASPFFGSRVKTKGIVTAFGTADWYPFGNDVYIQTSTPDDDDRTSEGLHVHIASNNADFELGDEIEVSGTVYEDLRRNGMGQTSIRDVTDFKVLSRGNPLPQAIIIGERGRPVPTDRISTYYGKLMRKKSLLLTDGIDFWESLEGMRIEMEDLQILGFRGGEEDLIQISDRFYLNLYVVAKSQHSGGARTNQNGLMIDFHKEDFNPEVVVITTNHLTKFGGLVPKDKNAAKYIFNVGDEIVGKTTGVLTYQKNVFGGGEYAIVLPEEQESFVKRKHRREPTPVVDRGITSLVSKADNEITVATYNLENLAGYQVDRILVMGESIAQNLQCPDIINLVEIQDNNGIDVRGTSDATQTLKKLRGITQSLCIDKRYEFVNLDPFLHAEGGQPGGNIRVSMMYNSLKVSYQERVDGSVGSQAIVQENGILSSNPGKIFPNHSAFQRSRRSVVTEFDVLAKPGEKLYVIGNHLNSKLGDIDFWGNNQPARANSDFRRARMAAKVNQFIRWLELENSKANIVVLGDFNALAEEGSLSVLSNKEKTLKNMIFTLDEKDRYTTNHNGNSQPLDYIFVNNRLFDNGAKSEVMHINSDYMGRLSDHDPVMLKIVF